MATLILSESSRDGVLASVSLARRLPGGADLAFATRDRLDFALRTPGHRDRRATGASEEWQAREAEGRPSDRGVPYRIVVVGADLAPARRDDIARVLRDDPAERIDWIDASEWDGPGDLCRGGGRWFNRPVTHHAFLAIDAAAEELSLAHDPFTMVLREIAEGGQGDIGRAWRDALDVLAERTHELPASVKPLLHGIPAEIGVLDRGEGDAMRADLDDMVAKSKLFTTATSHGGVVLLVLPVAGKVPLARLTEAAFAKADAALALVLFDRSPLAVIAGRRRGAEPPVNVKPLAESLLALPFVRRDRVQPGSVVLSLVDPPADSMKQLVAAMS